MKLTDNNNNEVKQTRLDGNSEIYNKNRDDLPPEERWKQMSKLEKLIYYKEYYLKYTIIVLILLIVGGYVVYTLTKPPKEDTIYLAMIDGIQFDKDIKESIPGTFSDYLKGNNFDGFNKKERVFFESYYNTLVEQVEIDNFYDKGKIDSIIARPPNFNSFAAANTFLDLSEVLPKDLFKKISDRLVYVKGANDEAAKPYGIKIENANYKLYTADDEVIEDAIIGIVCNSKHKNTSIELIKFLFN